MLAVTAGKAKTMVFLPYNSLISLALLFDKMAKMDFFNILAINRHQHNFNIYPIA
jgi:hypothetical protein